MDKNFVDCVPFKMNKVVITSNAIALMRKTWDLMLALVVLKGCLKTDILATNFDEDIIAYLTKKSLVHYSAEKPFEQ